MVDRWNAARIPSQEGRIVVVTGATSGLGFETAKALARRGATVVLTGRDRSSATAATDRLRTEVPGDRLRPVALDLASLRSVREAAERIRKEYPRIDLLINNAGVTGLTQPTEDGFEPQMGINHLGHFALTGHLLPCLVRSPGSRVVAISSIGHWLTSLTRENLQTAKQSYERSKLANLVFARELDRRLRESGAETRAVAAHPGGATTGIFRHSGAGFRAVSLAVARALGRTPEMGALPTLRAATDPEISGGDYVGPTGLLGMRGYPGKVSSSSSSRDAEVGALLWEESERITGVRYLPGAEARGAIRNGT